MKSFNCKVVFCGLMFLVLALPTAQAGEGSLRSWFKLFLPSNSTTDPNIINKATCDPNIINKSTTDPNIINKFMYGSPASSTTDPNIINK